MDHADHFIHSISLEASGEETCNVRMRNLCL